MLNYFSISFPLIQTDRSLSPLFYSLLPQSYSMTEELRKVRRQLRREIIELVDELGPKIYGNKFEQIRTIFSHEEMNHDQGEPISIPGTPTTSRIDNNVSTSPSTSKQLISNIEIFDASNDDLLFNYSDYKDFYYNSENINTRLKKRLKEKKLSNENLAQAESSAFHY